MKTASYTIAQKIEINLEIDIYFQNSHIYTTSNLIETFTNTSSKKGDKFIVICIEHDLQNYESITDLPAYVRPTLLIIFGILSLFTQNVFTPFETSQSQSMIGSKSTVQKTKFRLNNKSLLSDYRLIEKFIQLNSESKKRLFYSLIDRWRKAYYLEINSEDTMISDDEVLLSYFHILELLVEEYYPKQKETLLNSIESFSRSSLEDILLLEGTLLNSEVKSKKKLIESLFLSEISITSKICFMLKEQGLLNSRLKNLIQDLVKDRNAVAHGRNAYKERIIFPVPPFFPLTSKSHDFEIIRILTARIIAVFSGLKLFQNEWTEIDKNLIPTYDELIKFINQKAYLQITQDEFYTGKISEITPSTFVNYLLLKKLKPEDAVTPLQTLIKNHRNNEAEITELIIGVIIIADICPIPLQQDCICLIELASKNNWHPYLKMRDILHQLEYLGFKPSIFKQLLTTGKIY